MTESGRIPLCELGHSASAAPRYYYDPDTEEEALAEDEAGYEGASSAVMAVPVALVPVFRELIAKHEASQPQ
ncbi:MAG: hypothetical protein IID44_07115 [Planctomycetes bacterium]|nr:hypothetical protein [Planctomycetota bacterium]